jgi:hypothetical protein
MDLRMGQPTLDAWKIILVVGPLVRRYGERSPTAFGLAVLRTERVSLAREKGSKLERASQAQSASPVVRRPRNQNGFQALLKGILS